MREIVAIQAGLALAALELMTCAVAGARLLVLTLVSPSPLGQCGNQIGAKFWEVSPPPPPTQCSNSNRLPGWAACSGGLDAL